MNVFRETFHIDLVLIFLRGLKVIIGLDWLGTNRAMIDCERYLVRVRTSSEGELFIHGERTSYVPALCSDMRARRLLQQTTGLFWVLGLCLKQKGGGHARVE